MYQVGNKKPPLETRFGGVNANPRINKPIGAREKQITKARKLLERAATMNDVQKAIFDIDISGLTELDAIYLIQLEKAKLGDKDAFKMCMDYSGYKPSEHVEFNDITESQFADEQEEHEYHTRRMIEMINETDSVVKEANDLAGNI